MKKKQKRLLLAGLLFLLVLVMLPCSAQAAKRVPKYRNTWREYRGHYYYYNNSGKKVTGIRKIGKRQYYFGSTGIQGRGWKKLGKHYYYFKNSYGSKAYMVKSRTVNGIRLDKYGHADQRGRNLRKLKLMARATKIVGALTKPTMSLEQKLRICFDYTKNHYQYGFVRPFTPFTDWEKAFAEDMLFRGRGDCVSYGAAFAYLANAAGAKDVYVICSGGHGWAEISGKVYDPDWALVSSVDSYFAMPYSLSGVQGRPNYAPNRTYVAKV